MEDPESDPYKPFYRALALLIDPHERTGLGLSRPPTVDEAQAILEASSPYFADAIQRSRGTFEHLYHFMMDVWEG